MTTIILTLAGCASEDFVGNKELHEANENGRPVSFDLTSAPQTRSERYGAEAASDLNNNFVVWGDKTMNDNSTQKVFDNYQVNYVTNSANTTTTNSAGWEYIGCENVPNGVTSIGVTAFSESESNTGVYQTIKYWDFSATQYNFYAYSLGKGVEDTPATDPKTYTYATSSAMTPDGYSLTGSVDELAACYITDKVIKTDMATNTQVSLKFRRLAAKVKIALYETIPGYSVKDVRFYRDGSVASGAAAADGYGTTAYLYAADYAEPTPTILSHTDGEGTISVNYGSETPTIGWTAKNSEKEKPYISFGDSDPTATDWENWAGREYKMQAEGKYIGRSSTSATGPKDFMSVLPSPSVATPADLTLKVDYTLLSRDDTEEEIHVKGKTAIVPAQFAAWKPNYAYTYIFKITDSELHPITLDAVYVNAEGQQETITTVTEPSITTYQKGSDYATADEYDANDGDIYVVVYDGSEVMTLLTENTVPSTFINAQLFTATLLDGATQTITEATVADALKNGTQSPSGTWTVAGQMTVTEVSNLLSTVTEIPAADGGTITINGVKFTPTAGMTYVFRYTKTIPAVYYTQEEADEYNTANNLQEEDSGYKTTADIKTPAALASPAEYQYKVIKVKAAP